MSLACHQHREGGSPQMYLMSKASSKKGRDTPKCPISLRPFRVFLFYTCILQVVAIQA